MAEQRSHKRAGRPECNLFDDQCGPLKRRTETKDGTVKTLKGAICFACGKECKKTNRLAWLYHIAGKAGDPGQGWAKCLKQDDFEERDLAEWRDELEELLAPGEEAPHGFHAAQSAARLQWWGWRHEWWLAPLDGLWRR